VALPHQHLVHEHLADVQVADGPAVVVAVHHLEACGAPVREGCERPAGAAAPGLTLLGGVDLGEAHALAAAGYAQREGVTVVNRDDGPLLDLVRTFTGGEPAPSRLSERQGEQQERHGEGDPASRGAHAARILRVDPRGGPLHWRRGTMPKLSHLDAADRAALDRVRRDLDAAFGEMLLAVALSGEAAGSGYRPRRSVLELAVVLQEVTPDALRRVRPRLAAWARARVATPLFLDPRWLASARDAFPIEFLVLREQHVLLHGQRDPFADLPVDREPLRLEVERQLRGKLLHLWEAYLETRGSRRRLRRLLQEAVPSFVWILGGALHLTTGEGPPAARPTDAETVLAEAERRFGVSLASLRRLERTRRGAEPLPADALDALFDATLAEVRALVQITDGR
jgi:hypothetical protein